MKFYKQSSLGCFWGDGERHKEMQQWVGREGTVQLWTLQGLSFRDTHYIIDIMRQTKQLSVNCGHETLHKTIKVQ